jgi:hypothetical protein
MYIYKRNGERYFKNGTQTKESTVPQEVKDKLIMGMPEVEFDEQPDRRKCIFCDAPQAHQRYLNNEMIDLCSFHYHSMSLGRVAQQVNIIKKEQERKQWLSANATQAKVVLKKRRTARRVKRNSTLSTQVKVATQ